MAACISAAELATTARPAAGSSSQGEIEPSAPPLKRLRKKLAEAERLVELRKGGRELSREELDKVAKIDGWRRQIALLEAGALAATPKACSTPTASSARTPASVLSGARTERADNAGRAAAACNAALDTLESLPRSVESRRGTRASATEVQAQLAREQQALERKRQEAVEAAAEAELHLWSLLKAPFDSWGDEVFWQLAMAEYAFLHIDDVASAPRQLQQAFREECEAVRHPAEVPRQRGSQQIDALQDALHRCPLLQDELQSQLVRYKQLYCALLSGFGRFRKVAPLPGESLIDLMGRTHTSALGWRPPGAAPKEKLALVSKDKGRYTAEWRQDTYQQRHTDTGRTLSLRGTAGVTNAGLRRLKQLPESERPATEHPGTIRRHDYQVHHIQRAKSLTNSFAVKRCMLQWDEATLNSLAWCVIILNCVRAGGTREREVRRPSHRCRAPLPPHPTPPHTPC